MRPFVTIAVVAIIAPLARPCEDIAVVSYDAKYMLLDGETLETRDVGNLRWMGVWGVDAVIPGSTSARFAFVTGALSAEFAQPDESGFFQGSALVVVTNLAERDNTASEIAISHGYEFAPTGDARLWIDGTDQLLVREGKRSRVTVLDEGLNEVEVWSAAKWDTGPLLAAGGEATYTSLQARAGRLGGTAKASWTNWRYPRDSRTVASRTETREVAALKVRRLDVGEPWDVGATDGT